MAHDPIAAPTVTLSENREPFFRHPEQEAAAQRRIADYSARHGGRRPNVLVVLMDDVGWGDFGCYGGGVAVGAPTPHIDRLAAGGRRPAVYVLLLRTVVHAVARVAAHRTPADAARPAAPADGVMQKYPYGRLYNLYLDPKETRSYLIRKLAYLEAFQSGVKNHLMSFKKYPPKVVVGL